MSLIPFPLAVIDLMTPEQQVFVATLVFLAIVLQFVVIVIAVGVGRYFGERANQERAFSRGYAIGRRDERYESARDPLMPRTWGEAPVIVRDVPGGGATISTR